jgi:hypothetical protein
MSTLRTTFLQNAAASSPNITLDANNNATFAGTVVASSPMMFRNRIINGDMRIDQRNGGTATANTINGYTVDRWIVGQTVTGKLTAQRNAGSVTPPSGYSNYLGVTSQSNYSVLTSDIYRIYQLIEGFNVSDLAWGTAAARTVTLSFWVQSSLTGTFGGAIGTAAGSRTYIFTYTINAANTWEYKTITIPGDTSGTYQTDSTASIAVQWGFGVGATFSGSAGSWTASALVSATGATSVVGTSGATFYLTGVQLEVGSAATPFERRNYQQELAMCQRYCVVYGGDTAYERVGGGQAYSATQAIIVTHLPVEMRTTPSFTTSGNFAISNVNAVALAATSITNDSTSKKILQVVAVVSTGLSAGAATQLFTNNSTASRFIVSAEL